MTVLSDEVLRVDLIDAAGGDTPDAASFASPRLAVGKALSDGWPVGSGPYEIADATSAASAGENAAELRPARPVEPTQRPGVADGPPRLPLAFRFSPGDDPRHALDTGVDVLVTGDPDAIDYALARGSYATAPLPWDGVYVLFTPIGSDDEVRPVGVPPAVLDELARDAVPGDARASLLDASWTCPATRPGTARKRRRPRIAFLAGDRAAAGLAERLVARALTDRAGWIGDAMPAARGAPLTAAAVSAAELAASLRAGADAAYVVRLDLGARRPCPGSSSSARLRAIPLVDTRQTAILRRGLEGVTVDGAGTLHFAGAWRRAMAEPRR